MDLEKKIELITREPTEEILTNGELRHLLETNDKPIAYNGFEPSGPMHLGTGLICAYKMKDLIEAGVQFKAYLATWHALINDKLNGDINLINKAADHFKHGWLSLGVPEKKIEFLYADKEYDNKEYWYEVVNIAKKMTVNRGIRTLEILGREAGKTGNMEIAKLLYTPMQVADVFHFNIDICQLGTDQRKANVVAREVSEKLGHHKPVCVHHHLLQGLTQPPIWPIPEGEEGKKAISAAKMSKSKPETAIFIYDEPEDIKKKMRKAFCPEKVIDHNPVIDMCKHIIFREYDTITIERPSKFGGNLELQNFEELKKIYSEGKLHPLDLKNMVADKLSDILAPTREYFKKNKEAREGKELVYQSKITR